MSKGNTTENDYIKIAFRNNYDPSWRTQSNLYLALHTGDPGESGNQSTNETTYQGYSRVAVPKDASGWNISDNQASNADLIQFPQCTGGSPETVTHVSIGISSTGAGQILYSGALNASLQVSNLIQPQFAIGALVIEED